MSTKNGGSESPRSRSRRERATNRPDHAIKLARTRALMISLVEIVSLPGTSRWGLSHAARSVSAAGIRARAHVIGTNNLSDFPAHVLQARDMEAKGPRVRARLTRPELRDGVRRRPADSRFVRNPP
jgi:hypothetical protein